MGKIAERMAPFPAGGRGAGKGGRAGKEALAIEASPGAEIHFERRETLINNMSEVRIPAYAKINLRLDILGKRTDGFTNCARFFRPFRCTMNYGCGLRG